MAKKGYHDEASIRAAKEKAGIAFSVSGNAGRETIDQSLALAQKLGIQSTQATLIGNRLLAGYVPYDSLKALVAEQLAQQ